MNEREKRLKRLKIRSWRRGTKEMDLILGPFFDSQGAALDDAVLDDYERLLGENDQDLYQWFSGQAEPPAAIAPVLTRIREHHEALAGKS